LLNLQVLPRDPSWFEQQWDQLRALALTRGIVLRPLSGPPPRSQVRTTPDGKFEFPPVEDFPYQVVPDPWSDAIGVEAAYWEQPSEGGRARSVLFPGNVLLMRIMDPAGKPIPGARVKPNCELLTWARPKSGDVVVPVPVATPSSESGKVFLELPWGTSCRVWIELAGFQPRELTDSDLVPEPRTVVLQPSAPSRR
jgi:hypothetical protein